MTQSAKNMISQLESNEIEEIIEDAQSENWDKVKCSCGCGRIISIFEAINIGGDPYSRRCI